jgi:hypothetical protein
MRPYLSDNAAETGTPSAGHEWPQIAAAKSFMPLGFVTKQRTAACARQCPSHARSLGTCRCVLLIFILPMRIATIAAAIRFANVGN